MASFSELVYWFIGQTILCIRDRDKLDYVWTYPCLDSYGSLYISYISVVSYHLLFMERNGLTRRSFVIKLIGKLKTHLRYVDTKTIYILHKNVDNGFDIFLLKFWTNTFDFIPHFIKKPCIEIIVYQITMITLQYWALNIEFKKSATASFVSSYHVKMCLKLCHLIIINEK